jgi:Icc-related predicted phosphoesterase
MTELAPDFTWMGRVGAFELHGLKVIGVSGIEVERLRRGRGERPEERIGVLDEEIMAAIELGPADILMIHEWPSGIYNGDYSGMRRIQGEVGSSLLRSLVDLLQPKLLVCGHMHRPYRTSILHTSGKTEVVCLPHVEFGPESVAVFKVENGTMEEC